MGKRAPERKRDFGAVPPRPVLKPGEKAWYIRYHKRQLMKHGNVFLRTLFSTFGMIAIHLIFVSVLGVLIFLFDVPLFSAVAPGVLRVMINYAVLAPIYFFVAHLFLLRAKKRHKKYLAMGKKFIYENPSKGSFLLDVLDADDSVSLIKKTGYEMRFHADWKKVVLHDRIGWIRDPAADLSRGQTEQREEKRSQAGRKSR